VPRCNAPRPRSHGESPLEVQMSKDVRMQDAYTRCVGIGFRSTILECSVVCPPGVMMRNTPRSQHQTPSKGRNDSSDDHLVTVLSFHLQFLEESCHRRLDDAGACQNDKRRCSMNENVSKRRTVPDALSPPLQVKISPVGTLTRSKTRSEFPNGPQAAISSINP
jgi:hypothetical protein